MSRINLTAGCPYRGPGVQGPGQCGSPEITHIVIFKSGRVAPFGVCAAHVDAYRGLENDADTPVTVHPATVLATQITYQIEVEYETST